MIIRSIQINNFRKYKEASINFNEGIIGIVGKNGSGKSTIFNAIIFSLYGILPTDKKFIKYVYASHNVPVRVELSFEVDNSIYKVIRELKGKNLSHHAQLFKNDISIASSHDAVSSKIESIIGMDKNSFIKSVFSAQGELREISNARGSERREMIRKIMGFDYLDDILKMIRENKKEIKDYITGQSSMLLTDDEIKEKHELINKYKEDLLEINKKVESLNRKIDNTNKLLKKVKGEFDKLNNIRILFNEKNQLLIKLEGKLKSKKELNKDLEKRLNILKKEKSELENIKVHNDRFFELKEKIKQIEQDRLLFVEKNELKKQIDNLNKELKNKTKILNEQSEIIKTKKSLQENIRELEEKKERLNEDIKNLTNDKEILIQRKGAIEKSITERKTHIDKIKSIGKNADCPLCLRPLMDAYDNTIEKLNKEINDLQNELVDKISQDIELIINKIVYSNNEKDNCSKQLNDLNKKLAQVFEVEKNYKLIKDEINDLKNQSESLLKRFNELKNISFDHKLYNNLLKENKELEAFHTRFLELSARVKDIHEVVKQIEINNEDIKRLQEEIKGVSIELDNIEFSEEGYNNTKNQYDELISEKDSLSANYQEKLNEKIKLENNIGKIEEEIKQNEINKKKIDTKQKELDKLNKLESLMDGFRSHILDYVKPIISNYASDLFFQLTGGKYQAIQMDEDFNFQIMDDDKWYPIQRFSGGEIDCANLCLRIAMSNAIKEISGSGVVGFMAFDEIFGSQDEDRRRMMLDILNKLQERYRQIFIITHIEDIKEHFPSILYVQSADNSAKVKWL